MQQRRGAQSSDDDDDDEDVASLVFTEASTGDNRVRLVLRRDWQDEQTSADRVSEWLEA